MTAATAEAAIAPLPRVRAAWVAQRTSLSIRKVQELAQAQRIPAAKLEGVWTFDTEQIERWIKQRESGPCDAPKQNIKPAYIPGPVPRASGGAFKSTGKSTAEAYALLIKRKPASDTTPGEPKSNASPKAAPKRGRMRSCGGAPRFSPAP